MPVSKKQIRGLARLHGYWIYKTFLSKTPAWPLEKKRDYVFRKIKTTLVRAYEGVPFYRERFDKAGFHPERDFHRPEDLQRLPVLTSQDVRAHFERMIDRRYLAGSVVAHTSGTTGQPMAFRLSESYVAFDYACMVRHWSLAGYRFRSRIAALRSYVPDSPDGPLWQYNRWQNALYMSAYHLKPSNCDKYVAELLRFRPDFIRAYPSSINVLAEFAYPYRQQLDFVRGIFTASETLLDSERATIERTFGKVLYDWYGMTEPAVVITERADHNGMEINWEYGYPELQEPTGTPDLSGSQEAEGLGSNERLLISTSLHNPVMPFIRYQTGDVVCLDDSSGSPPGPAELYPRIRSIRGRKDDCFVAPDGRRLPSLNFYSLLQSYSEILRFQFIQTAPDHVQVKLSLRPGVRQADALLDKLRTEIDKRLGPNLAFTLEVTDSFITSADGKTPVFLRRFKAAPAVTIAPWDSAS